MNREEAIAKALAKGATVEEIATEAALQARHVGTVPFNHMIRALQMHSWNNTKAEWTRLAAAFTVRANAKKRK